MALAVAVLCAALVALCNARAPHVHYLSKIKPAVGTRQQLSGQYFATLTTSPSKVAFEGGYVNVSWANYQFPTEGDWIGLFCPASETPFTRAPVTYRNLPIGKGINSTYGTMLFYVPNLRSDCQFYLLTGGAQFPLVEAVSAVVSISTPNYPNGVRLSLPTSDTSATVRVTWSTRNASQPVVRYGLTSGQYTDSAVAISSTYASTDMCDEPATGRGWIDPGMMHTAVLMNLRPGQTYFYTVGDSAVPGDAGSWAPESTFVAPGPASSMTAYVFGDMGQAPADSSHQHSWDYGNRGEINAINTTQRMLQEINATGAPNAVVHFGDISYAVGYQPEWDQFFELIRPVASRVPWMTSIGNHEMGNPAGFVPSEDSGGECGVTFMHRFIMPAPANTQRPDTPWFSFTLGPVKFVMMSTETDFSVGSVQYAWLQEALKVDRSVTPWLVFTGHRPMYIDSSWDDGPYSDQGFAAYMRTHLEGLLYSAKVDLALWGHHHTYQRTCPVYQEQCLQAGSAPTHVVVGTAGYQLTHNLETALPPYMVRAIDAYWGFSRMHATPTSLTLDYLINNSTTIIDTITLNK